MPGLLTVCDTASSDRLVALDTLQGILFLIAGHAEVLVVFWDEALGSNRLLAVMTDEACLMPAIALVFHLAGTWHDGLPALMALRRVLMGVAVGAQQLLCFGSKGLVHQRVLAPRAVETGVMPVPVLVGQILAVTSDRLPTLLTSAGKEGLKACHTVGIFLSQDVLLAKERLFAMVTIKALSHLDTGLFITWS